jgi:hypothetical protein
MSYSGPEFPWPKDYLLRKETLERDGLLVCLEFNVEHDGFVNFHVQILQGQRLRDHTLWPLHVSFGWVEEIGVDLLKAIHLKWHNRVVRLPVDWCGSGGTAFFGPCEFTECPLIREAKQLGWYRDRDMHISF